MMIETVFQEFLKEFQIKGTKPASEAQLGKAEAKLDFVLPASLRECYQICNGWILKTSYWSEPGTS
jgi:hypothetical protein